MALVDEIANLMEKARSTNASLDDTTRISALEAAQALVQAFISPREAVIYDVSYRPLVPMCIRMGVQLGVFQTICSSPDGGATTKDIADKSGASLDVVDQIMRLLAATGYVVEAGRQLFKPSPLTMTMADPAMEATTRICAETNNASTRCAPEYFRRNGNQFPPSFEDTPFQLGANTKLSFFDWLRENPSLAKDFQQFMAFRQAMSPNWVDWFDVEGAILDGYGKGQPDDTLIVDIGGGEGQQLRPFNRKFPPSAIPGRRIVQDRPNVIANIIQPASETGIEPMAYDFFTPQPVKGARVYYMHWIIHDWPDEQARAILTNIAEAMEPGYSRLIINDRIVPDKGCDFMTAAVGVVMMIQCAAVERTERQWRDLLSSISGFKDFEFHHPPAGTEGIIVVTT
ncbi:uncharacterized protein DSM5745_00922 [Aspergillus mulundensis]|uniref:Uncharacterized protein n=1 Tax=Aspergillus mulundensis TaxID=1810919 RepID=A0A3D8T4Y4_9EURO|nr:Uncharacterized protein DSM5745_00922 [Aspergillus mulundensis]RDW93600.1 Uncharacterized protein DSM5745_00922 [Aspergillus mulundensis]